MKLIHPHFHTEYIVYISGFTSGNCPIWNIRKPYELEVKNAGYVSLQWLLEYKNWPVSNAAMIVDQAIEYFNLEDKK